MAVARLGAGATLSVPSQSAGAGQLVATAITLSTEGAQLSGVQFDLEWEPALGLQIATGQELIHSGKLLYSAPLAPHSVRILIVGTDQGRISDGELVRLFVAVGSGVDSSQIKLSNLVGTTAGGDPVAVGTSTTTIRIDPTLPGNPVLSESVLNAASLRPGPVAPGEILTLLGVFGIDANSSATLVASVNGVRATVLYALGNQINTVVPFGLDSSIPAEFEVRNQDRLIARVTMPAADASPALFTQGGTGLGPGAILNQDYSLNSAGNPAPAGSIVMMYGTAFGPLNPPAGDGKPGIVSATVTPVSARIAGIPADVTYAGAAPGLPAGVVQINVRIPSGVSNGQAAVSLNVGSFGIPEGVTIALRE